MKQVVVRGRARTCEAALSGTPAAGSAGRYPITLTASNGTMPAATQVFTLTVAPTTTTPTPTPTPTATTTTPTTTSTTTTTTAPGVDQTRAATHVTDKSAILGATIAAHSTAVSYRFAYGLGALPTTLTPTTTLAASRTAQTVTAKITHLVLGSVYHYHLQITTGAGTTSHGPEMTLTTLRAHPRRVRDHIYFYWDQHPPYHYTVTGRILLPSGLPHAIACHTHGTATITARLGRSMIARHTVTVSATCTYASAFTFTRHQLTGSGRVRFHMRFTGNHQLYARQARTLNVLYGPDAKTRSG